MNITGEQILNIIANYNQTIWPMQIVGYLLCLIAFLAFLLPERNSARLANTILAFLWLWVAAMFWWPLRENVVNLLLAIVFTVQGVLFIVEIFMSNLAYRPSTNAPAGFGIIALVYALIYPLVGLLFGHTYPTMWLGVIFPCPLVIFTFGMLLVSQHSVPKYLLVIPLLMSLMGVLWVYLGVFEDVGLVLTGVLGTWLIWQRDREPSISDWPDKAPSPAA